MALRTIVIGLGKQSLENHLPALVQSQKLRLVGVCDIDATKVDEVVAKYNVVGNTDLKEMVATLDFDVALVSVPHNAYVNIIGILAEAGKHIIKEKPFATSVDEATRIMKILQTNPIYLGVTVQRRFNPIYQTFHQLKKYIGKIYSIEGQYTMNIPALDDGWRASKEVSGGGALIDMGYHFVDLLVWYFGMPNSVTARLTRGNRPNQNYDVEDTVHLLFDYDLSSHYNEKLIGNFVISRAYPEKQERVRVYGTAGMIEVTRGLIHRMDVNGNEIERLERTGGWSSAAVEQLDFFADKISSFVPSSMPDYSEHLQHIAVMEAAYKSDEVSSSCYPADFLEAIYSGVGGKV